MQSKLRLCIASVTACLFLIIANADTPSLAAGAQCGKASWYKMGTRTANGERMNPDGLTAAHRSLPFGTKVKVENLANGRSVVVRINDRGPFVGGRVIDVTRGAARALGFISRGVANVRLTVVNGAAALTGRC